MSSELWQGVERKLSARRSQVLLCVGLSIAFVALRWLLRSEPWNSDDMDLFQLSADAAAGRHWVFGAAGGATPGSPVPHPAFRIGLLPLAIPAIELLGAGATAFYLVPLTFALLAFASLYWVILTSFGPLLALAFALIHLVWPFELEHSSLFLTDLPAAATALVSLCLLEVASHRVGRTRTLCVVLAGLAAVETYLLRNNSLVLLGPAYLVFFLNRSTRWLSVGAGAVVLFGVFAQQLFLVYRGFSFGYDWTSVRADFADYAQFLPVYSWRAFIGRQFAYQVTTFGRGVTGDLAALLVAASLVLHLVVLRFERRPLVLAVAALGLFTWLLFSFSIYERVPGGVRAMVPVNFRYVQPFTYSSLVIWAWSISALRRRPRWQAASLALPALLLVFSCVTVVTRLPLTYLKSGTRRLVRTLEARLAEPAAPRVIAGIDTSLRVPRLFWGPGSARRAEWRELSPSALGDLAEGDSEALVLRDVTRELGMSRYLAPEARQAYRAQLARLEASLWGRDEFAFIDSKYALFARSHSEAALDSEGLRGLTHTPTAEPAGVPLLDGPACETTGPEAERTLVPLQSGPRRASCEFTRLTDGLVLPAAEARPSGSGVVLRVDAEFDSPATVSLELIESGADGLHRQTIGLAGGGVSYVPIVPRPRTGELFLVYRVGARAALGGQSVRIRPAEWRPQRFLEKPSGTAPETSDAVSAP